MPRIEGEYRSTPPTLGDGQQGVAQMDDSGNIRVTNSYDYYAIVATTTKLIKTGQGVLHSITLNKPVATGVVTVYNALTAITTLVMGTITVPASPMPVTLIYDVKFSTGLLVAVATAAMDITVSYK